MEDASLVSNKSFDLKRMGANDKISKPTNNWSNFGLDTLSLSSEPKSVFDGSTDPFKSPGGSSLIASNLQAIHVPSPLFSTQQITSTLMEPSQPPSTSNEEKNSLRARLLKLVESEVLTLKQVDNVLKEYPYETNIETLVFKAGLDDDQFDL